MNILLPPSATPLSNTYIVNVTPEIARGWLDVGCFNRKIDPEAVSKYVRMIQSGLWKRTHQGIAFTKEGILLDGQHRLLAVIKTGMTVPMVVFIDEAQENFEFIDCGKNRSNLDMIRLGQGDNTLNSLHTSTLRAFLAGPFCHTTQWSSAELNIEQRKHEKPILFIVDLFRGEKDRKLNDSTVRGLLARAYYHLPTEKITAFTAKLLNRGGGYRGDQMNYLVNSLYTWDDRRNNTKREIYKRGQQTLLAFLHDNPQPWTVKISLDAFPIPKN